MQKGKRDAVVLCVGGSRVHGGRGRNQLTQPVTWRNVLLCFIVSAEADRLTCSHLEPDAGLGEGRGVCAR